MKLDSSKTKDIISIYSDVITELKNRDVIRTNDLAGDFGKYLAINHYNTTSSLPNIIEAEVGTGSGNIDAISKNGDRYIIKTTTSNLAGPFIGPVSKDVENQQFTYLIIVKLNKELRLEKILEVSWEVFLKYKHWYEDTNSWNIDISKNLDGEAVSIHDIYRRKRIEVVIKSREYWYTYVDGVGEYWALIDKQKDKYTIFFIVVSSNESVIFDRLHFDSIENATQALIRNQYSKVEESNKTLYPKIPQPPFNEGHLMKIYSKYGAWK
jgi:hypothetical protein